MTTCGLGFAVVAGLGFSLNPLRTFGWAMFLIAIQGIYLALASFEMVTFPRDGSTVPGFVLGVGCVLFLLAIVENVVAWLRSRPASVAAQQWCLTLSALCIAFGLTTVFGGQIGGLDLLITSCFAAPPALLAASLRRSGQESYPEGMVRRPVPFPPEQPEN